MRPFGTWVAGGWLRSKFLLEAVSEALSLNGVGSATGVDVGQPLILPWWIFLGLSLTLLATREWSVSQSAL